MADPVLYGSTPLVLGKGGDAYACADLGIDPSTIGPGFRATEVVDGQRARELEYRERFYRCAQHDGKVFDFARRSRGFGERGGWHFKDILPQKLSTGPRKTEVY